MRRITLAQTFAAEAKAKASISKVLTDSSASSSDGRKSLIRKPTVDSQRHSRRSTIRQNCKDLVPQLAHGVPGYLNPQPKYFKDHLKEDMVVQKFDPMLDTDEEDTEVQVVFEDEYGDDFDYESLYPEVIQADDDEDDFRVSRDSKTAELIRESVAFSEAAPSEGKHSVPEQDLKVCQDDETLEEHTTQMYQRAVQDIREKQRSQVKPQVVPSIMQKGLEEYFFDREEDQIEKYKNGYNTWFFSDGSEILHRKHIISCLDSILVKEREKYKHIHDSLKQRWESGQERQVLIDGALVKFNNYYKETISKKNRAIRQTALEKAQKDDKVREINKYRKELECLQHMMEQSENRLNRFKIFERYLEMVKQESRGELTDIRDIIDRYGVLSQARASLISRDLKNQERVERSHHTLHKVINRQTNELLIYNNYLSELRVYRDTLQDDIFQLEEQLLHIKSTAANRTLLIGQIKMATHNLYQGLCKQLKQAAKIPPDDTFRQLQFIKGSMKEIIKLSKDVKVMLKAAAVLAHKEALERTRLEKEQKRKQKFALHAMGGEEDIAAVFRLKQD